MYTNSFGQFFFHIQQNSFDQIYHIIFIIYFRGYIQKLRPLPSTEFTKGEVDNLAKRLKLNTGTLTFIFTDGSASFISRRPFISFTRGDKKRR